MVANNRHAVALFLLALILRLAYLVEIRDTLYFQTLILDAEEYDYLAQALLEGDWWLATSRIYVHGPLYPALLALLKLSGAGPRGYAPVPSYPWGLYLVSCSTLLPVDFSPLPPLY